MEIRLTSPERHLPRSAASSHEFERSRYQTLLVIHTGNIPAVIGYGNAMRWHRESELYGLRGSKSPSEPDCVRAFRNRQPGRAIIAPGNCEN